MWSHMGHSGNSSTEQRIELMKRYIDEFGVESIQSLLADREFVGDDWFTYLVENKIPFVIRLRKDMHIETEDGKHFQFFSLLRKRYNGQWNSWLCGMARTPENLLRFEGKKIKNELVIVATNIPAPKSALRLYRKRWGIECLFADAKTKGFNIEDTHMIDPSKLTTLFIMVTLSLTCAKSWALEQTWSYRCSSQEMGRGSIRKKKLGRFEKSWFRTGLDALRNWILHDPEEALSAWRRYCPKRPISNRCIIQGNRLNKPLTILYFLNRGVRTHLFFRRFRMSCTPNDSTAPAFLTHFQAVEDPRQEGEVLYPLEEILLLVLCGVISGADGWTSIALYGQKKLELLRRLLPYENGTPSHDQLGILFSRLDMEVFQSCFISWVASLNETLEGVVAADGKTLRRSFDTSSSRAAIHMVSAWACDQKLVLGQRKVDDKSNEITAIPELLELLKIKGAIVAIDAMGCQRKICKNPVIKRRIM